jgi:hypothetical protein
MRDVQCKRCIEYKGNWCDKKRDDPDPYMVRDCHWFRTKTNFDGGVVMPDILIRGMEMPKSCDDCFLPLRYCPYAMKENGECPILPLPEGHGDLIDRDALKKRTPMVIDYSAGGFGTDGSIRPVRGYGDWQIDQAPTIVPAEGGAEDG